MRVVHSGKLVVKSNYDEVDWSVVIPVLTAFAFSLLGNKRFTNSRAQLSSDFAIETITRYLENKGKFDPSRNPDLINYLKYNILRQLISNFENSAGVRKRVIVDNIENEDLGNNLYSTNELYEKNNYIENNIDSQILLDKIKRKLKNKPDLKEIFDLLFHNESKRSEICDDLKIPLKEFDNRSRRLKRLLDGEIKLLLKHK
jgi:hypothetical protein